MDILRSFLKTLEPEAREAFAVRCGTTLGYLQKALSIGQPLGHGLCISIERESAGAVRCELLRDDVDWAYLRGTSEPATAPTQAAA